MYSMTWPYDPQHGEVGPVRWGTYGQLAPFAVLGVPVSQSPAVAPNEILIIRLS